MESTTKLPDIVQTRMLNVPIRKVWDVIATSDGIAAWFVLNDFKPVIGHEFHVEMEPPQGKTACKVTDIQPPTHLAFDVGKDWNWTFDLKDMDGRTELTFIWSGWDMNKSSEFGMPHKILHSHLVEGTNVFIKKLARTAEKRESSESETRASEGSKLKETNLRIIGMSCGHCIEKMEKVLQDFGVSGKVKLGSISFTYDENQVSLEEVKDAIEDLGYDIA